MFNEYRTTSPYGYRIHPINGNRSFHTGIDLVKGHKSPIGAFTAGEVLYAGMGNRGTGLGGYGIVVLIRDKNNRGQLYAHLDSVSVRKGQNVTKGQEVGKQGATGQVTGSHLHYEVRKKAQGRIPYGWVVTKSNMCFDPTKYLEEYNRFEFKNWNGSVINHSSKFKTEAQELQQRLVDLGYSLPRFGVDGRMGNETASAVRAFQKDAKIQVDGIPGPQTKKALEE